jgi:hypothetical protein
VSHGKYSFAVHVTHAGQGCGAGVGFADRNTFRPQTRNLGAAEGSWCFSKTGKKSNGSGQFEPYATGYRTGDVVTAEVDMDAAPPYIKFYVNGVDKGVAFTGPFSVAGSDPPVLVPAVVLGSTEGGNLTQLTAAMPAVTRFDSRRCHKNVTLQQHDRTATTDSRWGSVLADHVGVSSGVLRFAVKLAGDGGVAIGFADAGTFRAFTQNLGASPGTWALSKTGKVSCGDEEAFKPFVDKLVPEDVVGCEADMTEGA